ncbi:MAG: signal peptide peptidase SppA [Syntrophales bacterium]|jgi:protease-4|nr:signal peptide peptidase SppA [Syntrophales bacterium]MDY0044496.1 signal peptide peptidase SppA [Syntrophales bacterium]
MRKHPILYGLLLLIAAGCLIFLTAYGFVFFMGGEKTLSAGDKIAIVSVEGVIADARKVIEDLESHEDARDVKAIIIRVNSPGGGVVPSQEIYDKILSVRKKKKVIVSMGAVAASGGYYLAAAADKIVANPGTITGSIGVIIQFSQFQELMDKIGLKARIIKSGKYKDVGSPLREMNPEEAALIQSVTDDIHRQFIDAIANGRNMPVEKVESFADARIFTGRQALEYGLVDELGSLDHAIKLAADLAGIKGEPEVIYPKKKTSLLRYILSETFSEISEFMSENGTGIQYLYTGGEDRMGL